MPSGPGYLPLACAGGLQGSSSNVVSPTPTPAAESGQKLSQGVDLPRSLLCRLRKGTGTPSLGMRSSRSSPHPLSPSGSLPPTRGGGIHFYFWCYGSTVFLYTALWVGPPLPNLLPPLPL